MTTWLITGANRGIGLELTRQVRARGDGVIAVCRRASTALEQTGARIEAGIDVTSDEGVGFLVKRLADEPIDVLVNNAGVLERDALGEVDFAAVQRQFKVNAMGPLRVTQALLPRLRGSAKVVVITSRMGSIGDNTSGGYYGYRMSKAAVNAAFVSLARDLAPRGIAVGIFHPGMVATDMTGGQGISPAESATGLLTRIGALSLESSGRFLHQSGEALPW